MKKKIFLPVLIFIWSACFMLPAIAPAQQNQEPMVAAAEVPTTKPALTPPGYIAMAYYKLTGRAPDLDAWARQTDAYKNASPFEQPSVVASQVAQMKEAYNLLMVAEPLVVETQVKLSKYDATNRGFFVESFKTSTFFPASYNGQSYAIVPRDIVDKQWLKMDDPAVVAAVETAAAGSNRLLTMILLLTPQYADASKPATIDGETYWPIVVDVKQMMIYPLNGDTLLWQSNNTDVKDKNHQQILNLYQ